MTHAQMYSRILASDPTWNGQFFAGVLATGRYCLPSCKARKPKSENVRFFPSCDAARAVGLRPCLKCRPNAFAGGADSVLETLEGLVGEVRLQPARFKDGRAVVRRSGFGSTRCFELFRQHFHASPAEFLLRAKIEAARSALARGDASLVEIADGCGFESLSGLQEPFWAMNGMTPVAYRDLAKAAPFRIQLPADYPLPHFLRSLGRDPQSVSERLEGTSYRTAVDLAGIATLMRIEFTPADATVWLEADGAGQNQRIAAHRRVVAMLGLEQDAAAFSRLARRLGFARLVAGRPGLRLILTQSVFDGLLWSIIGQQINLAFACVLKRRLIENTGRPLTGGLYALPSPSVVADLKPAHLRAWQYSQKKAEYLIGAARLVADGTLDLEAMSLMSATRVERILSAVHGLGPWSVNYVMMRALGFADCVPLGDTGVTSGLQTLFKLEERPDVAATRRLMAVFSPHRSLATAHLWQINQPPL